MDAKAAGLLSKFPDLKITNSGKVRCDLSGHEMPCELEILQSYVKGKRFSSLKIYSDFDYASLQPFILSSVRKKNRLFCALTNRYISRKPHEVKGHVSGRRYAKALEQYQTGDLELFKERSSRNQLDLVRVNDEDTLDGDLLNPAIFPLSSSVSHEQSDSRDGMISSIESRTVVEVSKTDVNKEERKRRRKISAGVTGIRGSCDLEDVTKPIPSKKMRRIEKCIVIAKKRKERLKKTVCSNN